MQGKQKCTLDLENYIKYPDEKIEINWDDRRQAKSYNVKLTRGEDIALITLKNLQ